MSATESATATIAAGAAPEAAAAAISSPVPFNISVPQAALDELQAKLAATRFPDELEATAAWSQGPPLATIRRLVSAWQALDWRATEASINAQLAGQQFIAKIDAVAADGFGSLDIHFVHRRSKNPNAIPLLFVHGWPGSFLESLKLRELIEKSEETEQEGSGVDSPSFHLVAPSLPNFGFSSGALAQGFGLKQYASTLDALMRQLGYDQYVTQAGDWGYWITRTMGHLFPGRVRASHYNMIFAARPRWSTHPLLALQDRLLPRTAAERAAQKRTDWFREESQAYNFLQSTRPQTLGFALADSPVALLAWIAEKLHDWSDEYPWEDHEILAWVAVYWFGTAGPAAPQRIYHQVKHEKDPKLTYLSTLRSTPASVKLGLTYNPKELEIFPRTWGRTIGNVVFEAENAVGGHFYAHEHPEWLFRDLNTMFGRGGGAFGVIDGKNGYR